MENMPTSLRFIFIYLILTILWSCSSEPQATPEECVRQYAQYINQGKLEEAKKMCTPAGQAFLDALGEIIIASATDVDTSEIVIKNIKCLGTTDTIHCLSLEYDGFEDYEKEYWLTLTSEGWLIDHPTNKGAVKTSEEILEKEGK